MSRLILFVLADSSYEACEYSENYNMKNSCQQFEPTAFIARLLEVFWLARKRTYASINERANGKTSLMEKNAHFQISAESCIGQLNNS